jgi:Tfp pilus assembly protein PilW
MLQNHMKYLNNQRGASMVEYIMGAAIGVMILGVSIIVFTQQQSLIKDQNDSANIRAKGRQVMKTLAKEIRMAGYGLPPGQGIQDALSPTSITFRSNLNNVNTTLPPGGAGASEDDPNLTVLDATGFASGDNIVIYQPDFKTTELNGVSTPTSGTLITLSTNLGTDFEFGLNAQLITVNKYNDVVIQYTGNQITKTIDGGAPVILVNDLASTNGLTFNFNGAATAADVGRIGITVNLVDPKNADAVIEFKSDVDIRNS